MLAAKEIPTGGRGEKKKKKKKKSAKKVKEEPPPVRVSGDELLKMAKRIVQSKNEKIYQLSRWQRAGQQQQEQLEDSEPEEKVEKELTTTRPATREHV
jgi:hypothetical protein